MIPQRQPGQSFEDHQAEVAAWVGCDVVTLNEQHDRLHMALCGWIGVPSHSLACAHGETHDADLAVIEEEAVMHTQKLMARHGVALL